MNRINWKKGTVKAVVLFLVLFGLMASYMASAEEFNYEISAGATFVGGEKYESETLYMNQIFSKRKFQVGLLLMSGLDCPQSSECEDGEGEGNQAFFVQRLVHYKKLELGLGFSYWHKQTPAWNSHTPFALSVGYNFNDNLAINWRHFSTGGSSDHNPGLDMLTVRWRF